MTGRSAIGVSSDGAMAPDVTEHAAMAHCIVAILVAADDPEPKNSAAAVLYAQSDTLLDSHYFIEPGDWFGGDDVHVSMVIDDGVLWSRGQWEQDHEGARPMTDADEARLLATQGKQVVFANVHC